MQHLNKVFDPFLIIFDYRSSVSRVFATVKKSSLSLCLVGALGLALAPAANAQITLHFDYSDGTNVVATHTVAAGGINSWTTTTLANPQNTSAVSAGGYLSNPSSDLNIKTFTGQSITGLMPWASAGGAGSSDFGAGLGFFEAGGDVFGYAPVGFDYASGTLTGGINFAGTSLMDLGFASNSGSLSGDFNVAGTTVNWSTTGSAVPEPSSFAALAGLGAMGFVATRRRRRNVAAA